jgi:hypothetical protein
MAKRTTGSLAFSEYVSPDLDHSVQVWLARQEVIHAVQNVYPIFLEKLRTDVFPLYRELADQGKLAEGRNNFEKALWGNAPYEALTSEGGLKSALTKWAAEFHAEEDWLIVGALRTLRDWHVDPDWRESLAWDCRHGRKDRATIGKVFEFRHHGWEVQLLTWPAYSQLLRQEFEERLAEYERETRELAESQGLLRARDKYSPINFEWFVLYQFAGMTSTAIANRFVSEGEAPDESTILKGIKAAAKLIGWKHALGSRRKPNRKIE